VRTFLIVALVVVGLALVGTGIVYFVEPAKHLPSFFPGHAALHTHTHATKHGLVILGIGALALLLAVVVTRRSRQSLRPS
jgi:hypothetical protein